MANWAWINEFLCETYAKSMRNLCENKFVGVPRAPPQGAHNLFTPLGDPYTLNISPGGGARPHPGTARGRGNARAEAHFRREHCASSVYGCGAHIAICVRETYAKTMRKLWIPRANGHGEHRGPVLTGIQNRLPLFNEKLPHILIKKHQGKV